MTIIKGLHNNLKIKPEDIVNYLTGNYDEVNFLADAINFDVSRGAMNTSPQEPGTIGSNSLIDSNGYWVNKTGTAHRVYGAAATLTSDLIIAFGGTNGVVSPIVEGFNLTSNAWSTKTFLPSIIRYNAGSSLTSDLCLSIAGNNGAVTGLTYKFSNSVNNWVSRASVSGTTQNGASSLTSDLSLCIAGSNGLNTILVNRFSDNANTWTARSNYLIASNFLGASSLTSDVTLTSGGYNGVYLKNTSRFSDSINTWVSRNGLSIEKSPRVSAQTSDKAMILSGVNASIVFSSAEQFSDSSNTYSSKTDSAQTRYGQYTSSFSSNYCFNALGSSSLLGSAELFIDNLVALTSSLEIVSNQVNDSPAVPDRTSTNQINTVTLLTTAPKRILVSTLNRYAGTDKPTLDVSDDGGTTWSITNKQCDKTIDTSSLSGTDIRLRFTLPRLINSINGLGIANSWTSRGSSSIAKSNTAGTTLTSDISLGFGGANGTIFVTNEKFSDTANSWSTLTNNPLAKERLGSLSLSSDLSLATGGYNATLGGLPNVDRFSLSGNSWIARANISNKYTHASASFTNDLGLTIGGFNLTSNYIVDVQRYSDGANTWSSRANLSVIKGYMAGTALTTDLALISGGNNGTSNLNTVDRFSDSANAWISRLSLPYVVYLHYCASLTSDSLIRAGGHIAATTTYLPTAERYMDSGNMWVTRANMSLNRTGLTCNTMTSNNMLSFGGNNSAFLNSSERYTDGEFYFKGFGLKYE